MELSDFEILLLPQTQQAVEESLDSEPTAIAMNKHIANSALVATQVKYLQRAKHKLPSYYAVRAVLPPLAFEQSSSEETASHKQYRGELAIDLTCGLGVDSLALSRGFERVIAVERNETVARITRHNFERMGVRNVDVICGSAEEFLAGFEGRADLIYCDPDRRGEANKKLYLLEECSPNMVELAAEALRKAEKVVIKCSPMFDVDEALRLFGDHVSVTAVSLRGECKEMIIELNPSMLHPTRAANAIGLGTAEFMGMSHEVLPSDALPGWEAMKYLLVPDVALQKIRCVRQYFGRFEDIFAYSENGYVFCNRLNINPLARPYEIIWVEEYSPKRIKKRLKTDSITRVDIMKREFDLTTAQVAKALGVKEGGELSIACTTVGGKRYAILCRPPKK